MAPGALKPQSPNVPRSPAGVVSKRSSPRPPAGRPSTAGRMVAVASRLQRARQTAAAAGFDRLEAVVDEVEHELMAERLAQQHAKQRYAREIKGLESSVQRRPVAG